MIDLEQFATKKELFAYLYKNKDILATKKKSQLKKADAIFSNPILTYLKTGQNKDSAYEMQDLPKNLKVTVIINSTNFFDSHYDVHIPGIWSKSVSENKLIMHLQEHEMDFEHIISDGQDLKAYVKTFSWQELGYNYVGETECLVFESNIKKERNSFMLEQYLKGYVRNHSVGMQYVKFVLAINDEDYGAEYEAWQKYYPFIVNKDAVDQVGFFWAVKEAKAIEGSAVPLGSNTATPTLNIGKQEPQKGTPQNNEPSLDTQKAKQIITNQFNELKEWMKFN